jgi:hypothetical protein
MLIVLHFVLMMAAVLFLIAGISIAMFGQKRNYGSNGINVLI